MSMPNTIELILPKGASPLPFHCPFTGNLLIVDEPCPPEDPFQETFDPTFSDHVLYCVHLYPAPMSDLIYVHPQITACHQLGLIEVEQEQGYEFFVELADRFMGLVNSQWHWHLKITSEEVNSREIWLGFNTTGVMPEFVELNKDGSFFDEDDTENEEEEDDRGDEVKGRGRRMR